MALCVFVPTILIAYCYPRNHLAMKRQLFILAGIISCFLLSGCGLMELSFKSGFIIALIIAAIIGLLIWALHFSWKLLGRYFPRIRYYVEGILED